MQIRNFRSSAALPNHIHEAAHRQGIKMQTANVSRSAHVFFEHCGFVVVEYRKPVTRGVVVPYALMKKELSAHLSSGARELILEVAR